MTQIDDQPAPIPNTGRPIWELVIEDMRARDQVGRERYGTPLQAQNGRDPLVDAYQEALDLAVYLRQAIEERATQAFTIQTLKAAFEDAIADVAAHAGDYADNPRAKFIEEEAVARYRAVIADADRVFP